LTLHRIINEYCIINSRCALIGATDEQHNHPAAPAPVGAVTPRKKEVHLPQLVYRAKSNSTKVHIYITVQFCPLLGPSPVGGVLKIQNMFCYRAPGADLEGGVGGPNQEVWGMEVPKWGPGAKPRQGVWGRSPQKLEHFQKYTT